MPSSNELLSQALELNDTERAQLARGILQSLDAPGISDDDLKDELRSRLHDLESGAAKVIDGDEAMAELETAHQQRMQQGK